MTQSLKGLAAVLQSKGRYGDTVLAHINPIELKALRDLSPTGELTTNPDTGLPEAFLPMLLPLLGGIAGSFAGPALGLGVTAAMGGAIGAGLGSFAATGDVGKGIMSGVMGYGLGSAAGLLGGAGGAAGAAANAATDAGTWAAAASPAASALPHGAASVAADALSPAASAIPHGASAITDGLSGHALNVGKPESIFGDFDLSLPRLKDTFITNAGKTTLPIGVGLAGLFGDMGGGGGSGQSAGPPSQQSSPINLNVRTGRRYLGPGTPSPQGYEQRYFGYAQGGGVAGPGSGLDDAIPAIVNGRQPAALSDGEYVVPAHAVSALGNGSTSHGVRQLDGMVDNVMTKKFGTKNRKPRPINPAKMLPGGQGARPFASGGMVRLMNGQATMDDYLEAYAMLGSGKSRRRDYPVMDRSEQPQPQTMERGPTEQPEREYATDDSPDLATARDRISKIESGGNYGALGPMVGKDRAYGRYQVMGANVPSWSKEALGREMTPEEFLVDTKAQDAVFNHRFGGYMKKYGGAGASRAWFAGEGGMNNRGAKDALGTSVAEYERRSGFAGGGIIDEGMMFLGLRDRPLDPERSWDMDPKPYQPTMEDVQAAREYQRLYGKRDVPEGSRALNIDNPNVRYDAPASEMDTIHPNSAGYYADKRDRSFVSRNPLTQDMADRMAMAKLAAENSGDPFAYLGYDPDKMVVTQPPLGRGYNLAGNYAPRSDSTWVDGNDWNTPVHESMHRGYEIMRGRGADQLEGGNREVEPYKEEYLVRRQMRQAHGPVERDEAASITADKNRWDPALVNAEKDEPDMDKYIKKVKKKAHHEIARRTIEKHGGVR